MYFAGKWVYLIVLASVQLAVTEHFCDMFVYFAFVSMSCIVCT